jgi:hypothetical protein
VRLKSTLAPGSFKADILITGAEISTGLIAVQGFVFQNPTFFPKNLFFSTQVGKPSLPVELSVTIQNLSATAQTKIASTSSLFQVASPGSATFGSSVTLTGNGTFKVPVKFIGSTTVATFASNLQVSGTEINTKVVPLSAAVLPVPTPVVNPTSLSGFTAVEGGAPSAVKSFDLTVSGLPTQGSFSATITAPAGYVVSFSGVGGFVNALTAFANAGKISTKVFVLLTGNRPAGTVNGNLTITGNGINAKNLPLSGTVTAKPTPILNVDKTSMTFTTVAFKASDPQTYQLTGSNLPSGATVTAPAGYELRLGTSGTIFTNTLSVATSNGTLNATVSVRLKSSSTSTTVTGTLNNNVAGLTKSIVLSGKILSPPSLTLTPTTLNPFSTVKNQASAPQTYFVAATNLPAGATATVTAPTGYELRIQNTGSFVGTLTLSQVSAGTIARTLEVRLKSQSVTGNSTFTGNITHSVAGLSKTMSVTGTVLVPTLSVSTTSLTGFSALVNQPSASKTYTLTAANLPSNALGTVTAPAGYEVRLQNTGSFAGTLTLIQTATGRIDRTVEVRLKARATAGTVSGTLTHTVAGLSKTISLSGTVKAAALLGTASLRTTPLETCHALVGEPSWAQPWTMEVTGLQTGQVVKVKASAKFEFVNPDGTTTPHASVAADSAGNAKCTLKVRLKATQQAGPVEGSLTVTGPGLDKQLIAMNGLVESLAITPVSLPVFKADLGQPSDTQEITITPESASRVEVFASQFNFEVRLKGTSTFASRISLPGNGPFTVQIRLKPKPLFGSYGDNIKITRVLPDGSRVSRIYLVFGSVTLTTVNPTSLSGFTAPEGQVSAPQGFAVTVAGLSIQETDLVTVSAPKGYLVGLAKDVPASFVQALVLIPQNGKINATVFVRLGSQSAAGTVKGHVLISGNDIVSKKVSVNGTVTAKAQTTSSVAKPAEAALTTSPATATATVAPASLGGLVATEAQLAKATDARSFLLTVQGGPRSGLVRVAAPAGFLVGLSRNPAAFVRSLALPLTYALTDSIFVRLDGNQAGRYAGTVGITADFCAPAGVAVSGVILPKPTLTASPEAFSFFAHPNAPSAVQSYRLSAANLADGVTVAVKTTYGFEIGLNDSIFSPIGTLFLSQNVPHGVERTVYVRLKPRPLPTSVEGFVYNTTSDGSLKQTVALNGYVTFKPLPVTFVSVASLNGFSATESSPSATQSYKFSGGNLPPGTVISVNAPVGYAIRTGSMAYFTSSVTTQANQFGAFSLTISVRLNAGSTPGPVTGTITHAAYGLHQNVAVSGTVAAGATPAARAGSPAHPTEGAPHLEVNAYPNPVQDVLSVTLAAPAGRRLQLALTDLQGNLLLRREVLSQGEAQRVELPFGDRKPGVYLLRVQGTEGQRVLKIVKQ